MQGFLKDLSKDFSMFCEFQTLCVVYKAGQIVFCIIAKYVIFARKEFIGNVVISKFAASDYIQ